MKNWDLIAGSLTMIGNIKMNSIKVKSLFVTCSVLIVSCGVTNPVTEQEMNSSFQNVKAEAIAREEAPKANIANRVEVPQSNSVTSGRVWLTMFNESIADILPLLVENVRFDDDVEQSARSSIDVKDMPLADALYQILNPVGLYYVRENNGIIVKAQPSITFRAFKQPLHIVLDAMLGDSNVNYIVESGAGESLDLLINAQFVQVPLEQALSRVLSPIGLFWRREGDSYAIYRDREEIFHINFPLLEQSFDISSSRVAGSGESSKTTTTSAGLSKDGSQTDVQGGISSSNSVVRAFGSSGNLRGLDETLKGFMSENGQLVLHREVGTLWVRDRVDVVDRIGEFLGQINSKLNRPVHIKGIITEVSLTDQDSFGIDWQIVRENVAFNIANANTKISDIAQTAFSTSASTNTINNFASDAGVTSINSQSSPGNVTNVFVDALRKFGDVRVVSRPSLSVNNGSVGSLLVGNTISYVAQAYSSSTSSSSVTNSIIVKPLQTGVSFYVLPHIISDEEALIYVSPELSSLQSLRTIKNGNNTVEAPSLSMKQAQTVISVKNGESVIIGGLMSESESGENAGVKGIGDLPYIGSLFNSDKKTKGLTEFSLMMEVNW